MKSGGADQRTRTTALGLLAAFVLPAFFGLALVAPTPARAQMAVTDPAVEAAGASTAVDQKAATTNQIKDSVWTQVKRVTANTVALALLNAANYFATRIAYDVATKIASGGLSQKPLIATNWGDLVSNTALDAAGEALGTISEVSGLEKLGINLCSPRDPRIALNIKLGFINGLGRHYGGQPAPKCSWNQVAGNWDQFTSQSSDKVLDNIGVMFSPGQSSLSVAFEFNRYTQDLMSKKQQEAADKLVANKGFKDVTDYISGDIKTPAAAVQQEMIDTNKMAKDQQLMNVQITGQAFAAGAYEGVFKAAIKTFTNTLTEKLMKRVFDRGLISAGDLKRLVQDPKNNPVLNASTVGTGGQVAASLANADILTTQIFSSTNYDPLLEYSACPAQARSLYNCVMDDRMFTAVNRADGGAPLTVSQAIDQGFLNGNWRLVPLGSPKNLDRNCYLEAFCYSNLAKLRAARVIPIGWEMAANSPYNDPNSPVTLKEVMDRFNDCPYKDGADGKPVVDDSKLPDPLHPWCHMIDPDWVLKAPKAMCRMMAAGATLLDSQSSARAQVCVDTASCINEDAQGNCQGGYGYCTRETSAWKISADACEAQYASCQALVRADGKAVSYLLNTTTRAGVCNQDNAGCRAYSSSPNAVPNGGFEDAAGGIRDWTTTGSAGVDASGASAAHGDRAAYVYGGGRLSTAIGRDARTGLNVSPAKVVAGQDYQLSFSVRVEQSAPAARGVMTVTMLDASGKVMNGLCRTTLLNGQPKACTTNANCTSTGDTCGPVVTRQTCGTDILTQADAAGGSAGGVVFLAAAATHLGYQTRSCDITVPAGVAMVQVGLESRGLGSGNRLFFDDVALYGSAAYSAAPLDSTFLNSQAVACTENKVGCRAFVRAAPGALNLLRNPGFEDGTLGQNDQAANWDRLGTPPTAPASYQYGTGMAYEGSAAVKLAPRFGQEVRVLPETRYAVSAYSMNGSGAAARPVLGVEFLDAAGRHLAAPSDTDCVAGSGGNLALNLATGREYAQAACYFTTPAGTASAIVSLSDPSAGGVMVDAVQLELGSVATAYHDGYSSSAVALNLKVPPAGLACNGTATDPAECANYALACRREDVGCERYQPQDGGSAIPAVASSSDACPAECSGYETFRQEPASFANEVFLQHFIPDTAQSCSAVEAGCEEFTNLEKLAKGGEARESFTFLRACQKPDDRTATYYTWDGNDLRGYNLRTWTLQKSNDSAGATTADPSGGVPPCTNLRYDDLNQPVCNDTPSNQATCSKAEMQFNSECREFIDVAGNFHYRLYSRTVLASADCTEYRATRSDEGDCKGHGGAWIRSQCHYFAYAPESATCQATAVGCRAYTGNAARNIRIVFSDDFEAGTVSGWQQPGGGSTCDATRGGICPSTEAIAAGGHSLKVAAPSISKSLFDGGAPAVTRGKSYLLSFWAKGTGDLAAVFRADKSGLSPWTGASFGQVSLTTDWKTYVLGPVVFGKLPESGDSLVLDLQADAGRPAYLDNVQLREVSDSIYLIAGSWKTPAVCDQDLLHQPSPQYMLGCKTYQDRAGTQAYFRSFSRVCREEAVGCTALYDTQDSASPFVQTWNARCTVSAKYCSSTASSSAPTACSRDADCGAGDTCTPLCVPKAGETTCRCSAGSYACDVRSREASCNYDADVELPAAAVSPDGETKVVKADALAYYIDASKFRCDDADVGCARFGDKELAADNVQVTAWTPKFLKDSPDDYAKILCSKGEEGCQAYARAEDSASVYFKDPGARVCEYKTGVTIQGAAVSGWFQQGTETPCYGDYLLSGSVYGLWKNSDPKYSDWTGLCPSNQSLCKEFVDPTDVSPANRQGKPYYFLKNERLDTKSCNGQASRRKAPSSAKEASACALFRQSDDVNLKYDAAATYQASEDQFGALVTPVSKDNDANVIIRAQRDRQCAEWYDCRSSETVFNPSTGQFQSVCSSFALCSAAQKIGDTTRCVKYEASPYTGKVLDGKIYASRPVGWGSKEYSGYAIPNRYPLDELKTVNLAAPGATIGNPRLVRAAGSCTGDFTPCGAANNRGNRGTCISGACVWPIDGGAGIQRREDLQQKIGKAVMPAADCRAYPREDSPFPGSVADPSGWDTTVSEINGGSPRFLGASTAFQGANVCQRRVLKIAGSNDTVTYDSCECGYVQATYGGSVTRYFPLDGPDIPYGYCETGTYEGLECDPTAQGLRSRDNLSCCSKVGEVDPYTKSVSCEDDGMCRRLSKTDYVVGYQGQCVERDFSTPINGRSDEFACATWRPTGLVGGSWDIYNLNRSAGYFAPIDRRFYCAATSPSDKDRIEMGIVSQADRLNFSAKGVCKNKTSSIIDYPEWCNNPGGNDAVCSTDPDAHGRTTSGGPCVLPKVPEQLSNEGPKHQPANHFFGPGAVSQMVVGFRSQGSNDMIKTPASGSNSTVYYYNWPVDGGCPNAADLHGAAWCIFPGISTTCEMSSSTDKDAKGQLNCPAPGIYSLRDPVAYGIVGCYEVSDGETESGDPLTIEWPYIGPPIFRDQLANFEIDLVKSLYGNSDMSVGSQDVHLDGLGTVNFLNPTNPHQDVTENCNDDGNDSFIRSEGVVSCLLEDGNKWKKDCAERGGSATFELLFDRYGYLRSLKLTGHDNGDSGTFGVKSVAFDFKPACGIVTRVDEAGSLGLTQANTEYINSYRQFSQIPQPPPMPGAPPALQAMPISDYTQACRPWGAIGEQSQDPPPAGAAADTPTRWTRVSLHPTKDGKEVLTQQCTEQSYRQASSYSPASLGQLFRRTGPSWNYRPMSLANVSTDGKLTETLYVADLKANYLNNADRPPFTPQVASVEVSGCSADGSCPAKTPDAITVNGHDSGFLTGFDGVFPATVQFYAWASHSSMPVRARTVIWGDTSIEEPPASGWYKNRKPYCSPDESDKNAVSECVGGGLAGLTCRNNSDCPGGSCTSQSTAHFGNTPGACETTPYKFEHVYTCTLKDLQGLTDTCIVNPGTDRAVNAPCRRQLAAGWACVYSPKVQVKDNWGYCNCHGTPGSPCPAAGFSGDDCRAEKYPKPDGVTATPAPVPWTPWSGEIRLYPNAEDAKAFESL